MLELFQMSWSDLTQKMPELAEAGYSSLWLPQPAKGSSVWSVGYDIFDPFDLGDKNQQGTVATKYGTKAQLLQMVETAHRFGIRVYFDNVMNHRAGIVPGYDVYTPTNVFPGLWPQDFHLQTTANGNRNWPNVQNWNDQNYVQNEPINGLCDLATEPGGINYNFGPTLFSQSSKPYFVRQPNNPEYYMDANTVLLGSWTAGSSPGFSWPAGSWHGFNGTNGQPVAERVEDYLNRAAMWTLYTTKCDGFRMDAVKHVPSPFFGDYSTSWRGYVGGIQAMFDYTHGYGNNVLTNGYVESDDNRNSCFDTEAPRNDAMLFGEHLGPPPSYSEYIETGMRLLNSPLRDTLNGALGGNGNLPTGLDQSGFTPYSGAFSITQGVQFAEDQDALLCCPTHREMQNAYYFMHEGLPMIYSDGFNWAGNPSDPNTFPEVPMTDFLGQYGDNTMPETVMIHQHLARGGTRSRWSDAHIVAFERYDYREVSGDAYDNPDATVALFAMNATYNSPTGDVLFDDGVVRPSDNYYNCYNGSPSKGVGLVVGFPPGSVLGQLASTSPNGGNSRTCAKLLVHGATQSFQTAQQSLTNSDPSQRLIYVGNQNLAPGGGAIELLIPAGGWVMYAYQGPAPSRVNLLTNAITFKQGGGTVPTVMGYRHDGVNGDPNFSPIYPFKMRGSVDTSGNPVLYAGEGHVSTVTNASGAVQTLTNSYAIQIPVVTNAVFDIAVRSDASAANMLVKMDGGLDLNSQMGYAPTTGLDRRDNRPGYASDVYLGYEQAAQQFRDGPEKFAARLVSRNNVTSLGAETYYYTVGGTNQVVNGSGNGNNLNAETAAWVYHDPVAPTTVTTNASLPVAPLTQMVPTNPTPSQAVDIWVKVGYKFQIDTCYIYYTTDGSNPEGAFGVGKGTTHVVQAGWINADSQDGTIDWWKGTIPGAAASTQVRYKVALFLQNIPTITDADDSKLYGVTQFGITNFNPTTATVWLHNDLNTNNTTTGLETGFHIVRARCFLPRTNKSSVYNTFLQTFYYDGGLPSGVVAYPTTDGSSITGTSYTVVVRADSNVTEADYTITDGNGQQTGVASLVSPDATLSAQYPSYPQEFRFNYNPVASSGNATINVALKTVATSAYPSRTTTLTRTVQASAPATVVQISSPAPDGSVLILNSNDSYTIQTCFSTSLTANANNFSVLINDALQPRGSYIFRIGSAGNGCPGMRSLQYVWSLPTSGSNVIQVIYTNGITLSDTRTVAVARIGDPTDSDGDGVPNWMEIIAGTDPYDANSFLHITSLVPGNPVELLWSSVPGKNYQVYGTTNLAYPMTPIPNGAVSADPSNSTTRWFDLNPDAAHEFYRIEVQ
jgi:hypothetical protein